MVFKEVIVVFIKVLRNPHVHSVGKNADLVVVEEGGKSLLWYLINFISTSLRTSVYP